MFVFLPVQTDEEEYVRLTPEAGGVVGRGCKHIIVCVCERQKIVTEKKNEQMSI